MHADTFLKQLGKGNEESHARLQQALNFAMPYALGIFEQGPYEAELAAQRIFAGEEALKTRWLEKISVVVEAAGLQLPVVAADKIVYGGRKGFHSEYLKALLDEMCEVVRTDPEAEW